jgi:YidC/Oxa1 family membrane protein insertase
MLLAVVLSFLAVTAYGMLTGRGCTGPPPKETPKDGETPPPDDGEPKPAPDGEPAPAPAPGPGPAPAPAPAPAPDLSEHPQAGAPLARTRLESEELSVGFTSAGGAIDFVTLKEVRDSADSDRALDVILPVDPLLPMGATDETHLKPPASPGGPDREELPAGPMRLLNWTRDEAAEAATPEEDRVFTFRTPAGEVWTKRWWLPGGEGRFDLRLAISVRAPAGEPQRVPVKLLASSGQIRESVEGAFATPSGVVYRLSTSSDLSDTLPYGTDLIEIEGGGLRPTRVLTFGTRSAYFLSVLYAPEGESQAPITRAWATGEQADRRGAMGDALKAFYAREGQGTLDAARAARLHEGIQHLNHCWVVLDLERGPEAKPQELAFYIGPIARSTIRATDEYEALRAVLTYPSAFDWLADLLLWIYDLWRGIFGSAGLAVILMTLTVRGGLMPLSVRNQLGMRRYGRKVARLKPKVKALQERFGSNPRRLREEQMKLYREEGIGFPSGCLMMLVQIPIFFALFSSLRVEYTIRSASFLWIDDLSGPDKLIEFGQSFNLFVLQVSSLNILPLLMVALSLWHVRQMPPPADDQQAQQQKMMKWLPVIFAVILYNYTAALSLYMVLSSVIAIVESRIVRSRDAADGGAPVAGVPARA